MPGLFLLALVVLGVWAVMSRWLGRRGPVIDDPVGSPAPAPQQLAGAAPGVAAEPSGQPWMREPWVQRVILLSRAIGEGPRLTMPAELLQCAPFQALVEVMAEPHVEAETQFAYAAGDEAFPAWAALQALGRRPGSPEFEARLMARLNGFNAWTRDFILRALEAWAPTDPTLAGRVLVRLDESWVRTDFVVVIEDFLRRRAAVAPLSFEGVEVPAGFDLDDLRDVFKEGVDPALVAPFVAEFEQDRFKAVASSTSGAQNAAQPPGIGRLRRPGKVNADGAFAYPTADAVLTQLLESLTGSQPRSALVVGESGVGKSAVMSRVAAKLSREGWTIVEAGVLEINAGAKYVGELEGRIQSFIQRLSSPKHLWLAPELNRLLYAGRYRENPSGALDFLLPAIEAGEILVLGEMRPEALDRVTEERPDLPAHFEIARLRPPTAGELDGLLEAWAADARKSRRVEVAADLRREAIALAAQYLSGRTAPGGVLRLLDDAVTAAVRGSAKDAVVTLRLDHVVDSLRRLTGMPVEMLDERRTLDLDALRARFEQRVIGQPEAVSCIIERMALIKAGVTDPTRPYGVFLFAGGSGTGKTELAKTCAELLFGAADRLIRIDMSELQDPNALDRVIGRGGMGAAGRSLVERVRRQPFAVVLLDEFEKAHPRVWDLFLQVFDDGRLSDHAGETADFRHAIIILTSNLGTSETAGDTTLGLVGESAAFSPTSVTRAIERAFRPEFLNRLDRRLVFRPLTREVMRQIVRKELAEAFERQGLRRREWAVEMDESAVQLLVDLGFSPHFGARPLKRALERLLLAPLARAIVDRKAPEGEQFLFVRADGDKLAVEFADPDGAPTATRVSGAAPFDGSLAAIMYEPRGTHAEVARLRDTLEALSGLAGSESWRQRKEALLAEVSAAGFWERGDRHAILGRAEYLDRIESALRSAKSLLERLEGGSRAPREAYSRELERRLAQSLFLLDAASHEALDSGPRDAFVAIEPLQEAGERGDAGVEFVRRVAGMYEAWARARGMRVTAMESRSAAHPARTTLAISGFAAYALLAAEGGVHVLEVEGAGHAQPVRPSVRVRVVPQPPAPAHGEDALQRQVGEALAAGPAPGGNVVRRYREGANPLVRDSVRRWRTGRADRVFAGDFDIIPGDGDGSPSAVLG